MGLAALYIFYCHLFLVSSVNELQAYNKKNKKKTIGTLLNFLLQPLPELEMEAL